VTQKKNGKGRCHIHTIETTMHACRKKENNEGRKKGWNLLSLVGPFGVLGFGYFLEKRTFVGQPQNGGLGRGGRKGGRVWR
jgi:hypothetical protein